MIRLIISDCDGVLTDGKLYYGAEGEVLKVFNVKDGTAIKALMSEGAKFGVVSGRGSAALVRRAEELGLDFCQMNVSDKAEAVAALREQYGVAAHETLFVGDDTNDCVVRSECGHLYAVNDAAQALLEICDVQLKTKGGAGVFKEVLKRIHGN
ncbi:MAG: HAD hydrolase family protein [Bacteroidetes bacterium]|nr:HAD hydrolase family protein [Bacteroidota bacterium]